MNKKTKTIKSTPILRMRHLPAIVGVVAALITGPLLVVWKQVYLSHASVKSGALSDSLNVLSKEVVRLRFLTEKLSSTSRIEAIAREQLNLEYPLASQIVIMNQNGQKFAKTPDTSGFIAFLRKSIPWTRG